MEIRQQELKLVRKQRYLSAVLSIFMTSQPLMVTVVTFSVYGAIGNPLRASDGVEWILHAVGPNMNADKPLCLGGDYAQGTLLLGETYRAVFDRFHALLTGTPSSSQ